MLRDEKFAEIVFALPTHLVAISARFAPAAAEIIANPYDRCGHLPASKSLLDWLDEQADQYPPACAPFAVEGRDGFSKARWRAEQAIDSGVSSVRERLECLLTGKDIAVRAQILHAAEEALTAETTPTPAEETNGNN